VVGGLDELKKSIIVKTKLFLFGMKDKSILTLIGIGVIATLRIAGWYVFIKRPADLKAVDTYEKCIALGLPQIAIYPPQCTTPDGRTFIDPKATPVEEPTTGVGIANPASVYCTEQGGKLEIISEEPEDAPGGGGGQVGMCTLPNGNVCEEWAFFRGECK